MNLEISTSPETALVVDAVPLHTKFGIEDARIVAPGDAGRSVLLYRLEQRGTGQMPPLATSLRDERAIELMRTWISSLTSESAEYSNE